MPTLKATPGEISASSDLDRLRIEYAQRESRLADSDIYTPFNSAHLFLIQERQRAALALLRRHFCSTLHDRRILEVGCGYGGVLYEYLGYGATPTMLHGIDLLENRVHDAHATLPHLPLACADGQNLPYATGTFHLVLQYTAFSSVLDDQVRAKMAHEMLRVLQQPGGMIVWYDYWLNPANPQTRGIRPGEIKRLFPDCEYFFRRITLAPPLARRLVPTSWMLCYVFEKLKVFNTHYLVAVRKMTS